MPSKSKPVAPPSPDWLRRLRDIRGCKEELARIFGEARDRGDGWADAGKAAYILFTLTRMLEGAEIERRLEAVERALDERGGSQRPRINGRAHREARL